MRLLIKLTCLLAVTFVAVPAQASQTPETNRQGQEAAGAERGWFWQYWYQMQQEEAKREAQQQNKQTPPKQKTDPCKDARTWTASCGFVDPKGDYAFQSKQRDKLRQNAVMNPNDSKAVAGYQKYTAWAVNQSFTMMQMWQYNQLQDQSLNPVVSSPVASFALLAMADKRLDERMDVMKEIKRQGGFLIWFTRATCEACAISAPVIQGLGRSTGLDIYEASLGGGCHPGFAGQSCHQGAQVAEAAKALRVAYVPDLWLYLPKQDGWIRVSSGMEAIDAITARIQLFFGGVANAVAKGMKRASSDPSLPVSFDNNPMRVSHGVIGAGVPTHENP